MVMQMTEMLMPVVVVEIPTTKITARAPMARIHMIMVEKDNTVTVTTIVQLPKGMTTVTMSSTLKNHTRDLMTP
jgi:hypothetical protein